jgi:SAM-dependent methyltransferase
VPDDDVWLAYAPRVAEYVERLGSVEVMNPQDRELIARWAGAVTGPVIDAGCGPGLWTAFLRERGVAVEGVDPVPEFLASAGRRFPGVPFRRGHFDDLGAEPGTLGGLLSWYSIIHTPPADVPAVLAGFARHLRPGGSLLLGFCEGPQLVPFDHAVVTAYFWPVAAMRRELAAAGFEVCETHTRPEPGGRPHAAIVAHRVT